MNSQKSINMQSMKSKVTSGSRLILALLLTHWNAISVNYFSIFLGLLLNAVYETL